MTLQSSGPIKLSEIQSEFGGINPIALSEYYSGGVNVPAFTVGDNGPIPTSGSLSFSDFYGSENVDPTALFMTVGVNVTIRGYGPTFGTLVPDLFKGQTIAGIFGNPGASRVTVDISTGMLPQGYWNQLVIDGGGPTLLSKDAVYDPQAGSTQWRFEANSFNFPNATYTVTFL